MTAESGPVGWIRSLSRRFRPGGTTEPPVLSADVSFRSQVYQVRMPSTETGPEPIHIPVTGHSVRVELTALTEEPVTLTRLGAEVTQVNKVEFDGTTFTARQAPDLVFSDDVADAYRDGLDGYRPLAEPHFEAILDRKPPVVQTAHGSAQDPIVLPTTLRPGEPLTVLVAPVTGDARLTRWKLTLEWTVNGRRNRIRFPLEVTADTGMTVFSPGGKEPAPAPIDGIASDHWVPVPEGQQRRSRESSAPYIVGGHSGPDGIHADTDWGDPDRYRAAVRANDTDAWVYELLGLTVYVPTIENPPRPAMSQLDDTHLLWVFTSRDLFESVVPHEPGMPHDMTTTNFSGVLASLDDTIGLVLDPNTDEGLPLFPEMIVSLRKRQLKIIGDQARARAERMRDNPPQPLPAPERQK